LGVLIIENISPAEFSKSSNDFVETLRQSLKLSLENIDYHTDIVEKVRMEEELKTAAAVQQASQSGIDTSAVRSFMQIGIYFGLITGPVMTALIGALISSLVAFIAGKIK